uniref:Uncharacterized protein n=1 Tax=Arundo donax TaxID=35708 RepID=A0A0A9BI57_ARUDO
MAHSLSTGAAPVRAAGRTWTRSLLPRRGGGRNPPFLEEAAAAAEGAHICQQSGRTTRSNRHPPLRHRCRSRRFLAAQPLPRRRPRPEEAAAGGLDALWAPRSPPARRRTQSLRSPPPPRPPRPPARGPEGSWWVAAPLRRRRRRLPRRRRRTRWRWRRAAGCRGSGPWGRRRRRV